MARDRSPDSADKQAPGHIEKGPIEARQGYKGRPVLYVLGASLALAILAYLVLHLYFLGSIL